MPLLPNNSILISAVSFGEREYHMLSWYYAVKNLCPFKTGGLSGECHLREGPLCRYRLKLKFTDPSAGRL